MLFSRTCQCTPHSSDMRGPARREHCLSFQRENTREAIRAVRVVLRGHPESLPACYSAGQNAPSNHAPLPHEDPSAAGMHLEIRFGTALPAQPLQWVATPRCLPNEPFLLIPDCKFAQQDEGTV